MKKFLYKVLKKNKVMYDFIFEEIIKDRELEAIKKIIGNKQVFHQVMIKDKDVNITNSIFFDVRIENCYIQKMEQITMERCSIVHPLFEKDGGINTELE